MIQFDEYKVKLNNLAPALQELGAALGLVGLFCSVTNAPIASIVLSVEMFGATNLHSFALVSILCFGLSGWCSLYASQRHSPLKLEN